MFSSAIRMYLLGYIQLSVTAIRGVTNNLDFSSTIMTLNSIQFIIMFIFVVATPLMFSMFIEAHYPKGIKNKTTKHRYGSLFLNVEAGNPTKMYVMLIFVLRRLFTAVIIVFLRQNLILQIMCLTWST